MSESKFQADLNTNRLCLEDNQKLPLSQHNQEPPIAIVITLVTVCAIATIVIAWTMTPRVYLWFFQRNARKFDEYLQSDEMQAIKKKYFKVDLPVQILIMNRVYIDDNDSLCIFPLNEYADNFIDDEFLDRFGSVQRRKHFRYWFYNIFLRFSRFNKILYTIKNPFELNDIANSGSKKNNQKSHEGSTKVEESNQEVHYIQKCACSDYENSEESSISFSTSYEESLMAFEIESSDVQESRDNSLPFDSSWLEDKNFRKKFLKPVVYSETSLYLCYSLRDFIFSRLVFSPVSETFIICQVTLESIEFRIYRYFIGGFKLVFHVVFDVFDENGFEILAYVFEKLTTQTPGSKISTLLENMNNSACVPKMYSKKETNVKID